MTELAEPLTDEAKLDTLCAEVTSCAMTGWMATEVTTTGATLVRPRRFTKLANALLLICTAGMWGVVLSRSTSTDMDTLRLTVDDSGVVTRH